MGVWVSLCVGDVVVSVGGVCVGVNECKSVFQYVLHAYTASYNYINRPS